MSVPYASHCFECVHRYRRPVTYGPPVSHLNFPLFTFYFVDFSHIFNFLLPIFAV